MALVNFLASVPCVQYASFFGGEDYRRIFRFSPAIPFIFFIFCLLSLFVRVFKKTVLLFSTRFSVESCHQDFLRFETCFVLNV